MSGGSCQSKGREARETSKLIITHMGIFLYDVIMKESLEISQYWKPRPNFFTFDVIFSIMPDIEPEKSASKSKCPIGDYQQ
jgi:hypothetical protein